MNGSQTFDPFHFASSQACTQFKVQQKLILLQIILFSDAVKGILHIATFV